SRSCSQGPQDEASPLGRPNLPFSDTHLLRLKPHTTLTPFSYPYRWMTPQPAEVNCAEGALLLCPHSGPQLQSCRINQRLLSLAGTLSHSGSQHQLGTICPGPVTQI
ncbi:hypothetical protein GOODEAATRI_018781, partial [Goodea atripinnis]